MIKWGPTIAYWLVFWLGAGLLMWLVARIVFREQFNELRTIRRLINRIGPHFPEFDTDAIHTWVYRCAPHLWSGWRKRDFESLADFATPEFHRAAQADFAEASRLSHVHEARLEKVLKIHPLGIYMVGDGPAPADVELMLRIETKAVDCVRDPAEKIVAGAAGVRQVQHFWTLRHDGHRWRLHSVVLAERDATDLADRPPVPPMPEWHRPEPEESS